MVREKTLYDFARAAGTTVAVERQPESRFININGLRFHYLDWGSRGRCPMLLLHGSAQNAHMWDFFSLAFCADYNIIALDQRGHGDTDWASEGEYGTDQSIKDLEEFVRLMGWERFIIVGLSMGGRNAYIYGGLHPETLYGAVIVDVAPTIRSTGVNRVFQFMEDSSDEMDSVDAFVERALKYNPRRNYEETKGSIVNNLKQLPNGKWTWKYDKRFRNFNRARTMPRPQDPRWNEEALWGLVTKIDVPTLVVRGSESDMLQPEIAEKFQKMLPVGRLVTVSKAGHQVPGDNPVEFEGAVRQFLKEFQL